MKEKKVLHIAVEDRASVIELMEAVAATIRDIMQLLGASELTVSVKAKKRKPDNVVWEAVK